LRILFLSSWFPYPPDNGSKLRILNLLRGLSQHHELTIISFADHPVTELDLEPLYSFCKRIHVVPNKVFNPTGLRARLGYLSSTPRSIIDTFSDAMVACIEQTIKEDDYQIVIASQYKTAAYSQYFGNLPSLFEEIEIGLLFEQYTQATTVRNRIRHGLTWVKHRRHLGRILENYQVCTVVSEKEKELLSRFVSSNTEIEVIPNCVDIAEYDIFKEEREPASLIYTGSFGYEPNYEAMLWFIGDVYPYILAEIPEVQLTITGEHLDKPLPNPNGTKLTDFVPDVRPYIARSLISIAPLQSGGGTRLKILEAMALNTPVVATSKGAEGIDVKNGEHILIADSPQDFAEAVVKLLQTPELGTYIANNAYRLVQDKYDWEKVRPKFMGIVDKAVRNHALESIQNQ